MMDNLHGIAEFSLTADIAVGAGLAVTSLDLSTDFELEADVEATDTGGRPCGFWSVITSSL
jgi:hypothetical protein